MHGDDKLEKRSPWQWVKDKAKTFIGRGDDGRGKPTVNLKRIVDDDSDVEFKAASRPPSLVDYSSDEGPIVDDSDVELKAASHPRNFVDYSSDEEWHKKNRETITPYEPMTPAAEEIEQTEAVQDKLETSGLDSKDRTKQTIEAVQNKLGASVLDRKDRTNRYSVHDLKDHFEKMGSTQGAPGPERTSGVADANFSGVSVQILKSRFQLSPAKNEIVAQNSQQLEIENGQPRSRRNTYSHKQ